MPEQKYTYSISADFPDGAVHTGRLDAELRAATFSSASFLRLDGEGNALDVIFSGALSGADKTTLDGDATGPAGGLIAAHDNSPMSQDVVYVQMVDAQGAVKQWPIDPDGNLRIVPEPLAGSKFNVISVNWCDKCSWYETSVKVTDEALTDSGDGLTFNSAHTSWIDMKHGRLTDEDNILASNPTKWVVTAKSDGVTKAESPMLTTSADYQVDYPLGKITFNSSQAGKTILATYWYGVSGQFTVKPLPGKKIKILYVEVQFSKNIVLNDTMIFQAFGYAGVFAPQYVPTPYAATDLVPLQPANKYKRASDFVNESNGCYPLNPAFGGADRGLQNDVITLPWKYLTRTDLISAAGMEIRVGMENNVPHTGELGTATFYCISESE
jgi:hypothetical protein